MSADWRPADEPGLPRVFTGGWVGYCGYETVRFGYLGEQWRSQIYFTLQLRDSRIQDQKGTGELCSPAASHAAIHDRQHVVLPADRVRSNMGVRQLCSLKQLYQLVARSCWSILQLSPRLLHRQVTIQRGAV
jgi:hypothetical protein